MTKDQTFGIMLVGAASIAIQQAYPNTFTSVLMIATVVPAIYFMAKDLVTKLHLIRK